MKKHINKILSMLALMVLVSACKKDAILTVMEDVIFPSASFTASATNFDLTKANADEKLVTFSWDKVTYPIVAPVAYTLQFTTPADTLSATPWGSAYNVQVGEDVLTKSLTGKEISKIATEIGLVPNEFSTVVVRVQSEMDRKAYSKPISLSVKTYQAVTDFPSLWIAGDFQGWDIGNAVKISAYREAGVYEGYINVTGASNEFKIYTLKEWDSQSYGDGLDGKLVVANCACSNFKVPSNGVYNVIMNLNTMTYVLTKVEWGILGDASPGGWATDTELDFDPITQLWSVTADMKSDGSFKFRANKDWALDFGLNAEGELVNSNHPGYAYDDTVQNVTVPSTGNYTITLDLRDPGNFNYKLKKN